MKRKRSHAKFIEQLKRTVSSLKNMKPNDMHVITVHANYGNYELVIGPEREGQNRPVEINGEIHHLFVSSDSITTNPTKEQVDGKLRDTVIMQDLEIHLSDPSGDGIHAEGSNGSKKGVAPRGMINMAGASGEKILQRIEENGELEDATYQIIQEDILHALEKKEEEHQAEA